MLNCSLSTCDTELNEAILVTSYVDRLNESYSGLYCSYKHMIADAIGDIFTPEEFAEILTEHFPDLAAQIAPAQAEVILAPVAGDVDILFAADDLADDAVAGIDLGTEDNQFINDQLQNLDLFIDEFIMYSSSKAYTFSVNRLPSIFSHNNTDYQTVMYSLFSEDPAFAFNVTYGHDALTMSFSDASMNFGLVNLNDFFEHQDSAITKLYEVIEEKMNTTFGLIPAGDDDTAEAVDTNSASVTSQPATAPTF